MANVPKEDLILGRPFLATAHTKIDVFKKEISFGVYDERIVFNMSMVSSILHKEEASSCKADQIGEEISPILQISDDVFSYTTPLCSKYEQEVNSYPDDESFWDDTDEEDERLETGDEEGGPVTVAAKLHCCEPSTTMVNGSKITLPTCDPLVKYCYGGGMFRIRRLKKEAKVWWCFEDERIINKTWFQVHFKNAKLNETV